MTYGKHRFEVLDLNTDDPGAFGSARDLIRRRLDYQAQWGLSDLASARVALRFAEVSDKHSGRVV